MLDTSLDISTTFTASIDDLHEAIHRMPGAGKGATEPGYLSEARSLREVQHSNTDSGRAVILDFDN